MSKITKQQLKTYLWESANILRGKIDSGDFKHYILGLLFYKRLSDVFDEEYEKLKESVGEKLANDPIFSLYQKVVIGLMCYPPLQILEQKLTMLLQK